MQELLLGGSDSQAFDRQGDYRGDGPDEGHDTEDREHREPVLERADPAVAIVALGVVEIESRQVDRPQGDRFVFASRDGGVALLPDESVGYSVSESLPIVRPFGAVVLDQ